jgi:hypothetical protein
MKHFLLLSALIFLSFSSFGQSKQENLKIVWPEEYKWKVGNNQDDKSVHFTEIVPVDQSIEKWSILGTMLSLKNTKIPSTDQVIDMYTRSSLNESPVAKLTVIEKNEEAKNKWVLFKVEITDFPNDPHPESQLYYAIQGENTLYVNFIAVKEKTLSADFVDKWAKVFKSSELVYQ